MYLLEVDLEFQLRTDFLNSWTIHNPILFTVSSKVNIIYYFLLSVQVGWFILISNHSLNIVVNNVQKKNSDLMFHYLFLETVFRSSSRKFYLPPASEPFRNSEYDNPPSTRLLQKLLCLQTLFMEIHLGLYPFNADICILITYICI